MGDVLKDQKIESSTMLNELLDLLNFDCSFSSQIENVSIIILQYIKILSQYFNNMIISNSIN